MQRTAEGLLSRRLLHLYNVRQILKEIADNFLKLHEAKREKDCGGTFIEETFTIITFHTLYIRKIFLLDRF